MQFQESRYETAIDIIVTSLKKRRHPSFTTKLLILMLAIPKKKKKCDFILSDLKLALRMCFYNSN